MPMITRKFSKGYIKEKLDENDRHVKAAIKVLNNYDEVDTVALLRGIILHNLAISKELDLITEDEYLSRYNKWQDSMYSYWYDGKDKNKNEEYQKFKKALGLDELEDNTRMEDLGYKHVRKK